MNNKTHKAKCKCGKMAVWLYMPSNEMDPGDDMCCDDCVPRGCSCNHEQTKYENDGDYIEYEPEGEEGKDWQWTERYKTWENLDGEGRQLPCCEWWYDEEGIDLEDEKPEKWSEYDYLEED